MRVITRPVNPEKVVQVELHENSDGSVTVITSDGWNLITINEKGITLHESVGPSLGFALDEDGRLKVRRD